MILDSLILNNYNLYVWPAYIFCLLSCTYLFFSTKKELKKLEIIFFNEIKENREFQTEEKNKKETFSASPVF